MPLNHKKGTICCTICCFAGKRLSIIMLPEIKRRVIEDPQVIYQQNASRQWLQYNFGTLPAK